MMIIPRFVRRHLDLDAVTYVFMLVAVVLSFAAYRDSSSSSGREILQNKQRISAEAHVAKTACNDVHRVIVVLEGYIGGAAAAHPLVLPHLDPALAAALKAAELAGAKKDRELVAGLRGADCAKQIAKRHHR